MFIVKKISLSNFNTNKVINMSGMFYECKALEQLNISNFKTNNETDMRWMFDGSLMI